MTDRIEVTLNQAIDFARKGCHVVCYVEPGTIATSKRPGKKSNAPRITSERLITIDLEGEPPRQGESAKAWIALQQHFWGIDIKTRVPYKDIIDYIKSYGVNQSVASQLLHKFKVLRVVE